MFARRNVRNALTTCAGLAAMYQSDRLPDWLAVRAE